MERDIINLFENFRILRYRGESVLVAPPDYLDKLIEQAGSPGHLVDRARLHWTPLELCNN
jgi:hypothetical protein